MLGTRGVRLGILKPGLYRMQTKAILEAAIARKHAGGDPHVEIMIPLIVTRARARARHRLGTRGRGGDVRGVRRRRRRLPRRHDGGDAARRAGRRRGRRGGRVLLVRHQRPHPDDVRVLPRRRRGSLHDRVPRAASCSRRTRSRRSTRRVSANSCGWPSSGAGPPAPTCISASAASTAATRHRSRSSPSVGLDYVSCSPYRVPIARLAAAHAAPGRRPARDPRRSASVAVSPT